MGREQYENGAGESTECVEDRNILLLQTLDDAWNARDLETVARLHHEDVVVRWTGRSPTQGVLDHRRAATEFLAAFPDLQIEHRPYKMLIAKGDWTCSIARFTGTFNGPLKGSEHAPIAPTGRLVAIDIGRLARWHSGKIVEESVFYDLDELMRQVGVPRYDRAA